MPDPTPHPVTTDPNDRLARLEAELDRLRSEVADLRSTHPAHTGPLGDPGATDAPSAALDLRSARPSRRLVLGGAAAGAAAALIGVVSGAEPAAAATGTMVYGTTMDSGTSLTTLNGSGGRTLVVQNTAANSRAIAATATSGIAAEATSDSGTGLKATSLTSNAVQAIAVAGTALAAASDLTPLRLSCSSDRPAPTLDTTGHSVGEIVRDGEGSLWLCTKIGTPGTWRKLAGPATAGALHVLPTPVRIYDSRPGTSPAVGSKTKLAAGATRTLDATANASGVPADATAVVCTCLIVNAATGNGNFTIWAGGAPKPSANAMVWGGTDGRHSSLALTALGPGATIAVSSSITTDLVIDIVGYHR